MFTDEQQLKLMVDTHGARFDGRIWSVFDEEIVPFLPEEPAIADLGCGPGLFLFDLSQRLPNSHLYGLDGSKAALAFAANLSWGAQKFELSCRTLGERIDLKSASMDIVTMNFFLHQLDNPMPLLSDIKRVLKPGGFLWLYDWVRRPLPEYLRFWEVDPGLPPGVEPGLPVKLFAQHNKYTEGDWRYLFACAGLRPKLTVARARGQHMLFVVQHASEVNIG